MTLPEGWVETTLGECQGKTETVDPRRTPEVEYDLFSVPSYSAYQPEQAKGADIGSTKQKVLPNDVLLCKIVPHIRRGWVVPSKCGDRPQIASGEWIVFRDSALEPEFLRRFVLSDVFHAQFMLTVSGFGGSLMRARPAEAAKIVVPVPPLAEQRRIVAKVDALTASIGRARVDLERVSALADNLRASTVVAAMRGDLTARWRGEHNLYASPAAETEDAYERVAGMRRRKPALPVEWRPEITIPSSWRWASVDELVGVVQYGTSAKTTDDAGGVPVLRMGNIQRGALDWTKLKYLSASHDEFPALFLIDGDVLFNRTNSPELVGKAAVYRGNEPASFASYLIRLRCADILPDLLARYLNSPIGREWVGQVASQQVGQANVNGTKLKALGIPFPPMAEQIEMNRLLDAAFARADRLEAEATRARAVLDRLEAAILAKAFRGELVPQDPNDEPASVLLDRIRAERAAAPKPKRGRARKAVG